MFVAAYLATTVTGVAAVLASNIVTLDVIRALCTLLCWSATTVYSAVVVFAFVVLGRDQLFQISTRSRWQLVGLKLGVLAVLLTVQHLLTVGLQLQSLLEPAGADAAAVIGYVTLAKVVSIAAFLLSVTFLATLSKVLRGRGVSTSFFAVGLLVVIGVQAVLLWRIGAPNTQEFFIGVGGAAVHGQPLREHPAADPHWSERWLPAADLGSVDRLEPDRRDRVGRCLGCPRQSS
ncbi:hypothetical protein [Curtobacterium sp. MCPF17_052]|uniref:hypothetical protein n=1 Tax=Curtobacterium sp. MCPF17_052 TaxID=2175655 RepID=UPI0024DF4CF0|nr:hypothetical protein [Curtobacterium sp. MCPF17_052]WIB12310.1 hypothetical protein DEJ36_16615 [Curtobacterium sp. MCPF17_052]